VTTDGISHPAVHFQPQEAGMQPDITSRQRFLAACAIQPLDRPPVWIMRQAGRALPEYRALKEEYSFLDLVRTPDLATEVTLQPIRRFGFDAAVLFSDILVLPEALGQPYRFREGGGIEMEFAVRTAADVDRLNPNGLRERLDYVAQTLVRLRAELGSRTALLGFAGSPWTLANFMMEGGSAKQFTLAKELFYTDLALFDRLLSKLTAATIEHLNLQIDAGADAVQIFDSLGHLLAAEAYQPASARWIREIIQGLGDRVPVILFVRGIHGPWEPLVSTGARMLSVDWRVPLRSVRDQLPGHLGVQGNLDPFLLTTQPDVVVHATRELLESMRGQRGHIFNLGHGLPPQAKLENIEAMLRTIREFA
jgi:uroporphyrinogen decarboxylase